jgi:hypothetical protein
MHDHIEGGEEPSEEVIDHCYVDKHIVFGGGVDM